MNEKLILYFLITLVVIISLTDSSHADLMIAKFDVDKTLAFWTPERIKNAKPLTPKDIGFRNKTSRAKNLKIRNDNQSLMPPFDNPNNPLNYPVGRLSITDPDTGVSTICTASVFNTDNGNIGMTAGHCIFNNNGKQYENLMFSPGFDLGVPGPLGTLAVDLAAVPAEYHDDPFTYDYGMFRINFNDPNGFKLQDYTGANGWLLNPSQDNLITNVFGYPQNGDMPNCPNDGLHLCVIVRNVEVSVDGSVMPGVDLGSGSSGAPWTINHNDRNLGYMYGNQAFYNVQDNQSESPRYDPEIFNDLLEYVSDN